MRSSLSNEQKWLLLCNDRIQHSAPSQKNEPSAWVEKLSTPSQVSKAVLQQLRVVLSGQGRSWLNSFVDEGGLVKLLDLLDEDRNERVEGYHMQIVTCVKAFMNNQVCVVDF